MHLQKKAYALAILLLVVGGISIGVMAVTGRDIFSILTAKRTWILNVLLIAIGVSAVVVGLYRDSYLPFLGPTIMPCSLLRAQTPEGADTDVRIYAKPGATVLYWAAEPANKDLQGLNDWRKAYLGHRNAGVVVADSDGYATLKVRKPQAYSVPMKGALVPHIHYRVCREQGFIGRVETVTLDGKEYFENSESPEEGDMEYFEGAGYSEDRYVQPENALNEINYAAEQTAARSLMTAEGALDESKDQLRRGSPY